LVQNRARLGIGLVILGALSYVVIKEVAINFFAGHESSYAFYYSAMIPRNEGPFGLVRTMLVNPIFTLRHALDAEKVLYVLQVFAPVAFLPLLRFENLT